MSRRATLHCDAAVGIETNFKCTGLGGVAIEVSESLQCGEMVVHSGRGVEADRFADFTDAWRITPFLHVLLDHIEDLALARSKWF